MTPCPCVGAVHLDTACWHTDYVTCIRCGAVMRLARWDGNGHTCVDPRCSA